MAKDDDEKITTTKGELRGWLAQQQKEAAMGDDEKKLRGLIGEVIDEKLSSFFSFDDDEGGAGGGKSNAPGDKGEPKGFFDGLLAAVRGEEAE